MDTLNKNNRFQNQNWLVRFWRRRWLLYVPFDAVTIWLSNIGNKEIDQDDGYVSSITFSIAWKIAHGLAHMPDRMNWIYDWDEVKERLQSRLAQGPKDTVFTSQALEEHSIGCGEDFDKGAQN